MLFKRNSIWTLIWKNRMVYTLLIPGLIWYVIFCYGPMAGLSLAFKNYKANLGIFGSPWVGFKYFEYVFQDLSFFRSLVKTLTINSGRMIFQFPVPILLALMLNEIKFVRTKRTLQTILTFPHFLSWVVVASILINIFAFDGLVNSVIKLFGGETFNFLGNPSIFVPFLYITEVWKNAGWGAIVYLAAIASIDMDQYEAAVIDGANRFQKLVSITLPNIMPTIVVMFILAMGNLMTSGFDQVFNLSNAAVSDVAETLDMYIYRITFLTAPNFSFSTAVSLFRSLVNMILLLLADRGAKLMGSAGLLN
jgi:putative aldouronate transport system permease protein